MVGAVLVGFRLRCAVKNCVCPVYHEQKSPLSSFLILRFSSGISWCVWGEKGEDTGHKAKQCYRHFHVVVTQFYLFNTILWLKGYVPKLHMRGFIIREFWWNTQVPVKFNYSSLPTHSQINPFIHQSYMMENMTFTLRVCNRASFWWRNLCTPVSSLRFSSREFSG